MKNIRGRDWKFVVLLKYSIELILTQFSNARHISIFRNYACIICIPCREYVALSIRMVSVNG